MRNECKNMYKIARKSAGLSREEAAEMLHISVRSLADYEAGVTIPKDDIVCDMIRIYNAKWLGYEHLKQNTAIGRNYLPDISISDLAKSVLRLQKETKDLDMVNNDMITIACDGVVDETEKNKWNHVTKEISEMAGAALAVIFAR